MQYTKWTPEADQALLRVARRFEGKERIEWGEHLDDEPLLVDRVRGLAHPASALGYRYNALVKRGQARPAPKPHGNSAWTPHMDEALLAATDGMGRERINWAAVLAKSPLLRERIDGLRNPMICLRTRLTELWQKRDKAEAARARNNGAHEPEPEMPQPFTQAAPAYTDGCPHCPNCGTAMQGWNRAYNAMRNGTS